jgi:sugar lactone lactonase YvrE
MAQTYQWTTFAGGHGGPGFSDGSLSQPKFSHPWDVALDVNGNLYVADAMNYTIRKLTPSGAVSTFAGQAGLPGSTDGVGGSARFGLPQGVAVDASGNVYVADYSYHTIRKINAYGVVTTLAGLPQVSGSADGTGSAARFNRPSSLAVDASGNVYVADRTNHTIRKITSAGVVTTLAGSAGVSGSEDGTGSAARFYAPIGVAVDSAGHVYVAEEQNFTIRKITPVGVVTTLAGLAGQSGLVDGTGSAARFFFLAEIAVDAAGDLYVVDYQSVRKVTSAGVVTTLAGGNLTGSADGVGFAARFSSPKGLAVDAGGNVYVADLNNHTIRKMTPSAEVSRLAGSTGSEGSGDGPISSAKFFQPRGTATDGSGNVYVADKGNHTIRKVSPAGVVTTLAGTAGVSGTANGNGAAARFNAPQGIAAATDGTLYVADTSNHAIRKIIPGGEVTTFAGLAGTSGSINGTGSAARFNGPQGITLGGDGNLYVADTASHTLRKITPAGVVTTLAGSPGSSGTVDGTGIVARFASPGSVALDGAGIIYVGQSTIIRKVTPTGEVSSWAGTTSSGMVNGIGATARFRSITGIAADSSGVLYVADSNNSRIRRVGIDSSVTTFAGDYGYRDDIGSSARFNQPSGICLDASGNLHVAEQGNHTLRRVTIPAGMVTTIAGAPLSIGEGRADGHTISARFYTPRGVAVKADGTIYVADYYNGCIRVISPDGMVSVFAGKQGPNDTSADGAGPAAQFSYPAGLAVDATGNVYVAQSRAIRKVTPTGVVSTMAGSFFFPGTNNGTGGSARFGEEVEAIAVDSSGTLYVADTANHAIRKVTSAGVVTTLAGQGGSSGSVDGTGSVARFNSPSGVAVDGDGNVYVCDTFNHAIRKITPGGVVTTLAGSLGTFGNVDGTGAAARFQSPLGLSLDGSGNLLVVDRNNNRIRKVSLAGEVTTLVSGGPAAVGGGVFTADDTGVFPYSITAGPDGRIYVGDTTCFRVVMGTLAPVFTRLSPLSVPAGAASLRLKVDGFGFVPGSSVLWNGSPRPTVYLNPRQLEATIPGTDLVATAGPSQSVAVRVRNPDLSESGDKTFTIQNPTPPTFVIHPQSITAAPGASVTLSCTATGTAPISYQWRKDGQVVPGIAGQTLLLGNLEVDQAGSYQVTASNGVGSATSNVAVVTVAAPPEAAMVPVAGAIANGGSTVLSVNASGPGPLTYQWYRGAVGNTSQPMSGATSADFPTGSLTGSTTFWVRVSNAHGNASAGPYQVVVNPPAPVINSALTAAAVTGQYFSYTITALNQPATFATALLLDGLSLDNETGRITGIPRAPGTYDIMLSATNVTGTGQAVLQLTVAPPAPIITSARSVGGRAGLAYQYQVIATNTPASYSATGLPTGLSVNSTTGLISGTLGVSGTGSFQVHATNAGGTGSATVAYTFEPAIEPPSISSAASAAGRVNEAFSFLLKATNAPDSFAASGLPDGITLNTATGLLSGMPTTPGSSSVQVSASNGGGPGAAQVFTLSIAPRLEAPVITSLSAASGRRGQPFSFQITATNSATAFTASGLPAGLFLNSGSGLINGTPTDQGQFPVEVTASNSGGTSLPQTLSLNIARPLMVPVISNDSRVAGQKGRFLQFDLQASQNPTTYHANGLPAGLTLNANTGSITGIPSVMGTVSSSVWASNEDGPGSPLTLHFDLAAPPDVPVISLISPTANATVGEAFMLPIQASNEPDSYTASNLPPGLQLNTTDGVIAGTPSQAGIFAMSLTASNAGGTSLAVSLIITVSPPPSAPDILTASLPRGRLGINYSVQIAATQTPITSYSAGGLPQGLSISATGVISGQPAVTGTFSVSVRATNAIGQGPGKTMELIIDAAGAPVITSAASWVVTQATPASYQILATNAPSSYTATGLPDGMTLNPVSGLISGAAVAPGSFSARITASNGVGSSSSLTLAITIKALLTVPRITSSTEFRVTGGQSFSLQLEGTELPAARPMPDGNRFNVIDLLPTGVSLNPATGVISGSLFSGYSAIWRFSATNAAGTGPSRNISIYSQPPSGSNSPVISGPTSLTGVHQQSRGVSVQTNKTLYFSSLSARSSFDEYIFGSAHSSSSFSITPSFTGKGSYRLYAQIAVYSGWLSRNVSYYDSLRVGFPITINAAPGAPQLTTPQSAVARQGQPFQLELRSSQDNCRVWALGSTPSMSTGLSVTYGGGKNYLNGTPTQPGNYKITFVTEQVLGSKLRSMPTDLILSVQPAETLAQAAAPMMARASSFGEEGTAETFAAFGGEVSGNESPPPDVGPITGTYGVAFEHTLSADGPATRFELDPLKLPPGLALNENTGSITGEPELPGTYESTVTPYLDLDAGQPFTVQIVIAAAPGTPVISSPATAAAQVGAAFTYQAAASGSPENYSVQGLPETFVVDGATGLITGTPVYPGNHKIKLYATNEHGPGEAMELALAIAGAPGTPLITSAASASGQRGQALSHTLTASQTPTAFGCGALPYGLSLNAETGIISGTPDESGTFPVEVWGMNETGEGSHATLTLNIATSSSVPVITGPGTRTLNPSSPFSVQLTATNNPTSYNAPLLPDWASFDPYEGILTGTAPSSGTHSFVFSANNSMGVGPDFSVNLSTGQSPAALAAAAMAAAGLTGANAMLNAIPHNDGMQNLLKYAFNMNLSGPDSRTMAAGGSAGLPGITAQPNGGASIFRFEFLRRIGSGLIYTAEKSGELTNPSSWLPLSDVPTVIPVNATWERVIYEETYDASTTPRCFGRVVVSLP